MKLPSNMITLGDVQLEYWDAGAGPPIIFTASRHPEISGPRSRHDWARWDAYVYTPDPDALAAEFADRGVAFREPLGINSDQLRGFEVMDADGYVLYFGRPV